MHTLLHIEMAFSSMQQRDAAVTPQAIAFRPDDNSPFIRHLTRGRLLCYLLLN
jgi:hypothetical protein